MRLSLMRPGQAGKIIEVTCDGPVGQRLMEMGLFEGADVKVVRIAPLGDPLEVEIQGYRLSLRKVEADRVDVEPVMLAGPQPIDRELTGKAGWVEPAKTPTRKKPA